MTFPREYPLGVPALQVISSTNFENWDIRISKSINGVDGDTISGSIIFEAVTLTDASSINTDGSIETTSFVSCDTLTVLGQATVNEDLAVGGECEFSGDVQCLAALSASRLSSNRMWSTAATPQAIDTATPGDKMVANFITRDTFLVALSNSDDPTLPAVLTEVSTITDTDATPALRVQHGAQIRFHFYAAAGQSGGIGLHPNVFPASVIGLSPAELAGPQYGADDWIRVTLTNIGTTTSPKYSATIEMGVTP